jgi:hypothetical protein
MIAKYRFQSKASRQLAIVPPKKAYTIPDRFGKRFNTTLYIGRFRRESGYILARTVRYDAFDIAERRDRPDDHKASYESLRQWMKKKLSANDQKLGYLYVYEVDGINGFLKNGYTTQPVEKRHKDWCFDCSQNQAFCFQYLLSRRHSFQTRPVSKTYVTRS